MQTGAASTVSDAEVDHEVEQQASSIGVPFAELKGNLAKSGGLERMRAVLRRERAVDEVLSGFVETARVDVPAVGEAGRERPIC